MYQEHFGLSRPPFKITPDTSLFFEGSQRGAALDALTYAIRSGEGIIKVVGEVGSGKTMLCRMLELRLSKDLDIIYISNPSISPDNILHVIAHELNLDVNHEMSKVDVMQKIQAYLLEKHASNRQVVLFVEEAQSMPIETLEEIRLLSNLETDENKLLQMVLFGQTELDEKLSSTDIRQLKERITYSFNLLPFQQDDVLQYLNFRLRAVGYKGPDLFTKKTAALVKKYSDGLTRRINILADKSLLAAFSEGGHTITTGHIMSAAKDSEFRGSNENKKLALAVSFIAIPCALIAGYYIGIMVPQAQPDFANTTAGPVTELMSESSAITDDSDVTNVLPRTGNLISERVENTMNWLSSAQDNHYSIQLFTARTSDADNIEDFLEKAPETLDFSRIYIYETVVNGRSWYSVLYSDFATQDDAIENLEKLPTTLKANDPYLRRVSALKKDSARSRLQAEQAAYAN